MHFKPLDIRTLTFRRQLFGYRPSDVKDFIKHVVEDYESYQVKESELVVYRDDIENLQATIINQDLTIEKFKVTIDNLRTENERLQTFENEFQELEKMKSLAQKIADEVQDESERLLEEAKQQRDKLVQESETTRMNYLLNLQIELDELTNEKDLIESQISRKKTDLFKLEQEYEDVLVTKRRVSKEAHILKQEFQSFRGKLIQKYAEGLDEFMEEYKVLNPPIDEEKTKVMKLTSTRFG